ncbi:DoxX family protein [Nocardioides sp. Root190]|uniref:DoxX family protein n=1 Tax=Nocardioides sp. Root190 TaxID=1736488 RepID=UPI0006F65B18|nr:DoxX family protein [Nocardioides sp. Root190]KRB75079.1 DoxX family protein [Nocardioides sp. Root190]
MEIDLGAAIIRLAIGPMIVLHGLIKVFGHGGINGTVRWFDSIGFRHAALHARLAAATEVVAGLLITTGFITTGASAAFVGLMTVAIVTDHRGKGYFVFKGGFEYALLTAMLAVAMASIGPGAWSVDATLGLDLNGPLWALGAATLGVAAALGLLATSYRPSRNE